mmetsp:Transcript_35611/g.46871  ORF Transcript_35611/g.46871 Transcript_35611/m.46871 type:complete len:123 (+) Transcript_35611:94-462(+)
MPFFGQFNMTITSVVVLVPLLIWTLKSVCQLFKNVPSAALKTPAILIFLGPLVLQGSNFVAIQVESEQGLAMIALFAKLYMMILFYSFYFMVREVVFYEQLLQQNEAINADPAFTDGGSSQS